MRSEKCCSSLSLSLTVDTEQCCRLVYSSGILSGRPRGGQLGSPGRRLDTDGQVQAAL